MRSSLVVVSLVVVAALVSGSRLGAQELAISTRSPRFLYAPSPSATPVEIDPARYAALRRVVSLEIEAPTIGRLLAEIERQTGLAFAYSDRIPVDRPVTLRAESITVSSALAAILHDLAVDVVLAPTGHMTLVAVKGAAALAPGTVAGIVSDAKTGRALGGADVSLEGTQWRTVAGTNGHYRIEGVLPGTYTVRARSIGYTPSTLSVTVNDGQDATADFTLAKSVQQLDEVVTTGTVVPTEVRALPTPITVITARDIELQHPRRFDELIRLAVPGAVIEESDGTQDPTAQDMSLRGRSSFSGAGNNNPKIYIDGIETAEHGYLAINPASIERVEVVRGPQASALYGSDAMGGVIQIFTKRGAGVGRRPEIDASAAVGRIESAFPDNSGALKQQYDGSVGGRTGSGSYRVGASYGSAGDWLPNFEQRTASLTTALTLEQGPLSVGITGRYERAEYKQGFNSLLLATGSPFADPFPNYARTEGANQALGLRVAYQPATWWQHEAIVGVDQHDGPSESYRPRLTTPDDTLLFVGDNLFRRMSIGYHTVLTAVPASGLKATFTAGADHYVNKYESHGAHGAYTILPLVIDPVRGGTFYYRSRFNNSGVFGQMQLGFHEALFLTASVRAEDNSEFGTALRWPRSTRAGLTYVRDVGATTVKLRVSYGEATRPPLFGARDSSFQTSGPYVFVNLPNPGLRPERQHGPDMGVDLVLGRRGTLSVTYYNQAALDFVQQISILAKSTATVFATQYVNVGRVRNRGWEFEGSLNAGMITAKGNFAVTLTHPEDLGPIPEDATTKVGLQFFGMPTHTAALVVTATPIRTTSVTVGLGYLGSVRGFDGLAFFRCSGGTGPCPPDFTGYYMTSPAVTKFNVSLDQQLGRWVTGYVTVEDAANRGTRLSLSEGNIAAVPGRISSVGVRIRY